MVLASMGSIVSIVVLLYYCILLQSTSDLNTMVGQTFITVSA